MTSADLLLDAFERIREVFHQVVEDLTPEMLVIQIAPETNSIAWLLWHLTRVQDHHIADAAGTEQIWTAQGWYERFGLPFEVSATGYGQRIEQVQAVRVGTVDLLTGYFDAVHAQTCRYIGGLANPDLDRVVDRSWNPPVTLGVRLVSIIADDLQHAGQAAFLRGAILSGSGATPIQT